MKKTIETKKNSKTVTKGNSETVAQIVERINKEAAQQAENPIIKEKARHNNPASRAPRTKVENNVKYNIEEVLHEAGLSLEVGNLATYYELMHEMIAKKSIKMLQKINVSVDVREYPDMLSTSEMFLWAMLNSAYNDDINSDLHGLGWKPYKRIEKDIIGEVETKTEWLFEKPLEIIEEFGIEKGARVLFFVLADRCCQYLKQNVVFINNTKDGVIEAITNSNTVEQLQEKVKIAATHYNMLDRDDVEQSFEDETVEELTKNETACSTINKLETLLSKPQRKLLTRLVSGELTLSSLGGCQGESYKKMKESIRLGGIRPDELRTAFQMLNKQQLTYIEAEQLDTLTKRGLANMLVKMA